MTNPYFNCFLFVFFLISVSIPAKVTLGCCFFFFSARLKLVRLIESTCRMSLGNHVISWAFDTKMAAAFVHSATSWLLLLALRPRPLTLTCPVHVLRCLVGGKAASRDAQAIPDSVLRPFFCQYWQIPSWHPSIGHVAR